MTTRQYSLPAETRAPTGRTHAYTIGETDRLLVDPATLTDDLATALETGEVAHVAVTHHHPDHVGGVAACAREFDLTVWARAGRTDEFTAATGISPDRTFTPGDMLPAGDGIPVLDTPGHAPEHVAFEAADGFVAGDLAVAEGSVVVGAPEGDMRAYLTSLRRVVARSPERLYPGHGPTIEGPPATCKRLLDHRLNRERRIAAAVEDGATTLDSILDTAYEKDLTGVRDLARATVVAHLEKLAVEGRVRWNGDRARPV